MLKKHKSTVVASGHADFNHKARNTNLRQRATQVLLQKNMKNSWSLCKRPQRIDCSLWIKLKYSGNILSGWVGLIQTSYWILENVYRRFSSLKIFLVAKSPHNICLEIERHSLQWVFRNFDRPTVKSCSVFCLLPLKDKHK